jgi:hypothetical protein
VALSDSDLEARLRIALGGDDAMVAMPDDLADTVRSRHRRQKRSLLAMAAAGLAVALVFLGVQLISSGVLGSGERTDPATSPSVGEPEIAPLEIDFGTWPQRDGIAAYTLVATGVVYVDADTAEIVWESWTHQRTVIGQLGQDAVAEPEPFMTVGNRRDIVGNPAHDLVAWVEPAAETPGDLVVVQASTGRELARADLGGLAPEAATSPWVVIASVDSDSVYFSITPEPAILRGGDKVWTWQWSSRGSLINRPDAHGVHDVSGGTWARTVGPGFGFEDASGRLIREVEAAYSDATIFGVGLSPDGRFWHSVAYQEVLDLRTGERIVLDLPPPWANDSGLLPPEFGWTAATTVTYLADGQWTSCDVTGGCRTLAPCGFAYCRTHLPLN